MKKYLLIFVLLISAVLIGATITNTTPNLNLGAAVYPTPVRQSIAFDNDVNDVTVALGTINGWIDEIVIDSTGTDTSYKVYILDENSIAVWSKVNCTSASEPYRLPVTVTDGTNIFYGARVNGAVSIQIADCNDASMTDLDIYLYFRDYRK